MLDLFIPWLKPAKLVAAAIAGAMVIAPPAYLLGSYRGAAAERAAIEGETAKRTAELIKERSKDDQELRTLDDHALCVELLPDGVPDTACD